MHDSGRGTPGFSVTGALVAFATTAGVAAAITVLYRGMAEIMATEGGFVASGGPYEIVHPAPDWAWLIPLSIMAGMAFGGLGVWASLRGWGMNPALFAWMGLFLALGWNFLRLGLIDPPEEMGPQWGWTVPGVLFWLMGLAPVVLVFGAFRDAWDQLLGRQTDDVRHTWASPAAGAARPGYCAAQSLGVAAGVASGLALFGAVAVGY